MQSFNSRCSFQMLHCHPALKISICCSQGVKNFIWLKSVCRQRKTGPLSRSQSSWCWGGVEASLVPLTPLHPGDPQSAWCSFWVVGCPVGTVRRGLTTCFLGLTFSVRGKSFQPHKYQHAHCEKHSLSPISILLRIIVASGSLTCKQDTDCEGTLLTPGNSSELPGNSPDIPGNSPEVPGF